MLHRQGFTLMEIIVVMIILGVTIAIAFPNFTVPTEQARAGNVRNNLLAIYSAQQNYNNNYNTYCLAGSAAQTACASVSANCGDSLAALNCNLSLNIQDDGTYAYSCPAVGGAANTCTATRNGTASTNIVLALNAPIQLSTNVNPQCNTANNWCP
jgi:prepilin-type N-terminal cleavage/methylation domain-containing protein